MSGRWLLVAGCWLLVDGGAAAPHRRDELRERVPFEWPDEVGRGEVPFRQHAVVAAAAERSSDRCRAREEPLDDGSIPSGRSDVGVRHECVVDVRRDQRVIDGSAVVAHAEDRLTLTLTCVRRILVGAVEMGAEIVRRGSYEEWRANLDARRRGAIGSTRCDECD